MTLTDALLSVRDTGGRIRRSSWNFGSVNVDGAHLKDAKLFFTARDKARGGIVIARHWKPSVADVLADDWTIVARNGAADVREAVEVTP